MPRSPFAAPLTYTYEPRFLSNPLTGRPKALILLEAATESEWVARHLESLGHDVIVADPNFAPMYASRSRKVKTDKRDARALCEACHLGAFRRAHRSSDASRMLRKHLAAREALVQTPSRMISLCRSLLRQEAVRVPSGGAPTFPAACPGARAERGPGRCRRAPAQDTRTSV
jgi:transposase